MESVSEVKLLISNYQAEYGRLSGSNVEIVDNLNMAIPYIAAERGFIDAVIEPHQTRLLLRQSMRLLRDKEISRAAQARPDPDLSRPAAGEVIEQTALTSLDGSVVAVSGPGNARLQFRWFAGCPICSQHLGTFTARHGDVAAAGYHRGCGPPLCCRTAAGLSGRITVHRGRRSRPGALPTVRGGDRCVGDGRPERHAGRRPLGWAGC